MPDRAEVWYELGDLYFHWGRILDEEDPFARAVEYFRTALRLAPDFAPALQHSLMIAVATADHAEVARLRGQVEDGSEMASFADWHIAAARGDSAALRRIRRSIADLSAYTLYIIPAASMGYGLPLDEAHLAVADLLTRNTTPGEREVRLLMARVTALSAGRPQVAARALDAYAAINPTHADRLTVLDALYAGGDSTSGAAAAKRLTASPPNADDELENRCVAAQWHLWHGQPLVDGDTALPAQVRAAAGRGHGLRPSMLMTCAGVIEALAATTDIERDAALDRLEAFLQQGPFTGIANIDQPFDAVIPLARLRERAGDAAGALAAVRRGPFFHGNPAYPAEVALMEARLSARLLQPERAIAAYRRYLNMRPAPEPALRAQVDSARAELSVLLDGRG
jgi:tetratricopeptide (TPR) repeat protein